MKRVAELHTSVLPNLLDYSYNWFTNFIPWSVNPTQWSNTNNSLAICRRVVWVCWPFLWGWRLKGYACIPTRKNRWIQNFTESFVGNNGQSPWPYTFFVYRSVTVHTCNIFFPYQFDFGESLQKVKIENAI